MTCKAMNPEKNLTIYTRQEHEGMRIDAVLAAELAGFSRSLLQRKIAEGAVLLDDEVVTSKNKRVVPGMRIDVAVEQEGPSEVLAEPIPLDIVFEDGVLLVVSKPQGLVVHPAGGHEEGTLVNALLHHSSALSGINGPLRPGIVHRLDKDTSGLIVVAKTDEAHEALARQFFERTVERRYRGVVWHGFSHDEGVVDAPIARHPVTRLKRAVVEGGKPAVTEYRVIERMGRFTHIEAKLLTGRTHQIRVHMAHIGHPLVGDTLYGPKRQPFGLTAHLLHAQTLAFEHPCTGESMRFCLDPPDAFQHIVQKFKNRS